MLSVTQFLAVWATAIFAGAAIYINLVEHPARMKCSTGTALQVWAPSYKRATVMQAPLAVAGAVFGVCSWWLGASWVWLLAASLIFLVVPFTFVVIMPTNKKLLDPNRDSQSSETSILLRKWANLHAVRSTLGLSAATLMVWQLAFH